METSLRLGGDSKSLRIHAKQKLPVSSKSLLQFHGEIDTGTGSPSHLALFIRHFLPELSTSIGLGFELNKHKKPRCIVRGKKAFPITSNGLLGFNIKGKSDLDEKFAVTKGSGAIEMAWGILNFQRDQDVRLKVGYELFQKVPYFQVRENNWTFNSDFNGRWSIRYDL